MISMNPVQLYGIGSAGRCARGCVLALTLLFVAASTSARGDIYKWTDEQGRTVISNILPENPDKAKNVERIVKENKSAPAFKSAATPTEQMLLDKIENLERRLQPRHALPPPGPVAPPADYYADDGYYAPPPPPAPYYGAYAAAPVYYPRPTYAYPVAPVYAYAAYPRTFVSRPVYVSAPRGAGFRGGAVHRGRR